MQLDAQLVGRTELLIEKGRNLFQYRSSDPYKLSPHFDLASYTMWRNQSVTFLIDLLGSSHTYALQFGHAVPPAAGDVVLGTWVTTGLGILAAVHDDLTSWLFQQLQGVGFCGGVHRLVAAS